MDLGELKKRLKKVTLPIAQSETAKIITKDPHILRKKVDDFRRGLRPDGSIIGEYSDSPMGQEYRLFKMSINPLAGGNVDLILTGSTARKLGVDSLGNGVFAINSSDTKWDDLISKYGEDLKIIDPNTFINLQTDVYAPQLIQRIKSITGL